MGKFRKKPVVIEAMRWPGVGVGTIEETLAFENWFSENNGVARMIGQNLHIKTLEDGPNGEAKHVADAGDWVIKGVKGEFYPCKPDIFEATYEAV